MKKRITAAAAAGVMAATLVAVPAATASASETAANHNSGGLVTSSQQGCDDWVEVKAEWLTTKSKRAHLWRKAFADSEVTCDRLEDFWMPYAGCGISKDQKNEMKTRGQWSFGYTVDRAWSDKKAKKWARNGQAIGDANGRPWVGKDLVRAFVKGR